MGQQVGRIYMYMLFDRTRNQVIYPKTDRGTGVPKVPFVGVVKL